MMISLILLLIPAVSARARPIDDVNAAIVRRDFVRARSLLEPLAAAGDVQALDQLAELYSEGHGTVLDYKKAYSLRERAEARGDADAAFGLGAQLMSGEGCKPDSAKSDAMFRRALAAYERAGEKGDPKALATAARMYAIALGVPKDDARAAALFAKAKELYLPRARRGDVKAQRELADMLTYTSAAFNNPAEALDWRRKAAETGDAEALEELAYAVQYGVGLPADPVKAISLYEQAYAKGSAIAVIRLVFLYDFGHNFHIETDKAKAQEWRLKGDAMGESWHGCQAGDAFLKGEGVPRDETKALDLIRPRAAAGFSGCMSTLGKLYETGESVPKDGAEALKWYILAGLASDRSSRLKAEELRKTLDPAQVRDGEQRAAAFQLVAMPTPSPLPAVERPLVAAAPTADVSAAPAEAATSAPTPAPRLKERPDDFALLVGIEHYRGLPSADYAESDAQAMRERLIELGFPERNVISLTGDEATRSSMQAYLDEWLPKNVNEKSRVFFYFSGHGSPDASSGRAYLVPSDGNPRFLKSTAYALTDVYAALSRLPARQVLVALDSCFSGAGGRSVIPKGARPLVTKLDISAPSRGKLVIFAAAESDQISGDLDEERHGAFTYYLLQGLGGAAQDGSGAITAGGLEAYLSPKVADAARRQNRDQTPILDGNPSTVLFRFK